MNDINKQNLVLAEKKIREAKSIISEIRTRHNIDMDDEKEQDRLTKTYLGTIMGKLNDAQVFSETLFDMERQNG